jgi:hypothetical protein
MSPSHFAKFTIIEAVVLDWISITPNLEISICQISPFISKLVNSSFKKKKLYWDIIDIHWLVLNRQLLVKSSWKQGVIANTNSHSDLSATSQSTDKLDNQSSKLTQVTVQQYIWQESPVFVLPANAILWIFVLVLPSQGQLSLLEH